MYFSSSKDKNPILAYRLYFGVIDNILRLIMFYLKFLYLNVSGLTITLVFKLMSYDSHRLTFKRFHTPISPHHLHIIVLVFHLHQHIITIAFGHAFHHVKIIPLQTVDKS